MDLTVSCTVTVTATDCSVNALEAAARQGIHDAGQRLFVALVEVVERSLDTHDRACACGGRFESRGRAPRVLTTVVGAVQFTRRRLRCATCGTERDPPGRGVGAGAAPPRDAGHRRTRPVVGHGDGLRPRRGGAGLPLLALRLLKLNGECDTYWRRRGLTTV